MIKNIRLKNYRCYLDHSITFKKQSIVVGKNNAGKSTLIEAMTLVSIVTNRLRFLSFHDAPEWTGLGPHHRGVSPAIDDSDFNEVSLFHKYGAQPAIIEAGFTEGSLIKIFVSDKAKIFATVWDKKGKQITSRTESWRANLPKIAVLPQIRPVDRKETILDSDHVKRSLGSTLASSHFRNQLNVFTEHLPDLRQLSEKTWHGVRVLGLEGGGELPGSELTLMVQDDQFVAEVSWMGHGLQMWLQTLWFLARSKDAGTLILDEPDVYLHADLQRKLIRLLNSDGRQVVVATHSAEIISEVPPEQILIIDRVKETSSYATSLPAVQTVIESIGSAHNLSITRLWTAKRCLLVEGKDLSLLSIIYDKIYSTAEDSLNSIPSMPIGGWSGWPYAVGSSMLAKNSLGDEIAVYCVLDSDYFTKNQIDDRYRDAKSRHVRLHIWGRKEIENYILNPAVIARLIRGQKTKGGKISESVVIDKLSEIQNEMADDIFDHLSEQSQLLNKGAGVPAANRFARGVISKRAGSLEGRLSLASGKSVLSALSGWAKETYGVSFNANSVAREFRQDEIPEEMAVFLEAVHELTEVAGVRDKCVKDLESH